MSNLIFIPEAYALSVHNLNHESAPLIVSTDAISAILPWEVGFDSKDYIGGFNGYLLLVRGYYDFHNKKFNFEKYEISKSTFEFIYHSILGIRPFDALTEKLKALGLKNQEE
jgi:hypothetical protein